jgi:hypothetical protein
LAAKERKKEEILVRKEARIVLKKAEEEAQIERICTREPRKAFSTQSK